MNLYLFTYFMILIWIRTIYSQICVNFKIRGKNGDNWTKGKYTKLKRESWNASTLAKVAQILKKAKMPPDNASNIGPFYILLTQARNPN